MKKTMILALGAILTGGCMPKDAYKPQYPQQDPSFGVSAPYTFSKSEKYATENTSPIAVNSSTPPTPSKLQRKKIEKTLIFLNQEDSSGVKVVPRKQS